MKTSLRRRDYHNYVWKRKELVLVILQAAAIVFVLSYFFYRSVWAILPLSCVGVLYFFLVRQRKTQASKW